MRKINFVAFSLILNFNLFAQFNPTNISDLENSYTNYFKLNRELVFLHLNKTSVIKKEDLWLSAYVYNSRLNTPNNETVNLNLEVFDESGIFIESKTVLITGGKGSTYLNLNKDIYPEGKYLIKATTKYMENFNEDLSFMQPFEILDSNSGSINKNKKDFDLQLLPEGGHILANVKNNVGVKLIDSNGRPVIFNDGKLLDSENKIIGNFKSNQFGLSKFSYLAEAQQVYSIEVTTTDGEKIKEYLPKAELRGFNISGNNLRDQFFFKVSTNTNSKNLIIDKLFYVAIHQDGSIKDFAFKFPDDKLEASFKLSKDSLYPGINTVTFFDENFNPLLERLFFNDKNLKRIRVKANANGIVMDSIIVNLKSETLIKHNSLSISVLPGSTKSYNPEHNILSAFYIKPYVNGDLENGSYYFSDLNPLRIEYDMDLLLLTQGWSKFQWSSIYNSTPKELVEHEKGFNVKGIISRRREKNEKTILIKSKETGMFEIVEIENDDSFILKNIYVLDNSSLSYSLMNEKKNNILKPSITANIIPNKSHSNLITKYKYYKFNALGEQNKNFKDFILDVESLDTVNLKGYTTKSKIPRSVFQIIDSYVEVTDELALQYFNVTDYIAEHGFLVYYDEWYNFYIQNRIPTSIRKGLLLGPKIYFNGLPTDDVTILEYLRMDDVESIVINKSGIGYGVDAAGGVIKIQTRNGPRAQSVRDTFTEIITKNGFSLNKEFYAPKYISYSNDAFKNYGVIDWISDLSLGKNGDKSFKILNTIQPQISLFIEGITVDGNLISEVLNIQTRKTK